MAKIPETSRPAPEQIENITRGKSIFRSLTEPAASIHEPERRRRARLLSALLGTQFLLALLVTVVVIFATHAPSDVYMVAGSVPVLAFAYYLSRTPYYNLAALLAISTLSGAVFAAGAINPDPASMYFLILGVLMSSLFLSGRDTAFIMAITIVGIGLLLWGTFPALPVRDAVGVMVAVLCVGVLGIVGIKIRQQDLDEIQSQSISLRQSEERFHLVSYATNDVVWDWDLLTGKVWRNEGMKRIFGFQADQILPENEWWQARIHPEDREKVVKSMDTAISSGETFWSKEYRYQHSDGSYLHVFDRGYIIHDDNGKPIRMLGALMDITARKQAEEALAKEQYLQQTLLDNIPEHIYFKDTESRFITITKSLAKAFGLSDSVKAIGKSDFDFFTEEHARLAYEDEQLIIQTGNSISKEEMETWPDRPPTWVLTTKMPLRDLQGNIIGTFGVSKDITERKKGEAAQEQSERLFRALFELSPDSIVLIDPHDPNVSWPIFDCNVAAGTMSGYRRDELVGRSIDILNVTTGTQDERNAYMKQLREAGILNYETQHRRKDGTVYPIEVSTSLIKVGERELIIGIDRDITERKRDQEEIQQQSISLRQSEERFHLVSYATNDVVWDWDLLTGKIWRNQSMQRLFGFRPDQIGAEDKWWETQIHPDEREKVSQSIHSAIDSGEDFWSKEYRFRRADGSYIHVFDRGYIIHNDDGKPIRMLGALMDITAQKQAEEVLRQEAVHDPLTGLYNRRYMEEMLEREMQRSIRDQQQPISIIMLDIDHFKQVNDKFGHAVGDALLRQLGIFLLKHIRGSDIACRYGGDEFVLILPNAPMEIAQRRAEKLRTEAKDLMVEPYGKIMGELTLSLGVAVFPDQGSTRETIFQAADAALYQAKEAGRDQVAVAKIQQIAPNKQ